MFNLFQRKRRRTPRQKKSHNIETLSIEEKTELPSADTCIQKVSDNPFDVFSDHIYKYIGSTVTIFVSAGGICGLGFTGILISSNHSYIRLITQVGPPPACSLFNCCSTIRKKLFYANYSLYTLGKPITHLGSITCIPVNKIVGFVHNAI